VVVLLALVIMISLSAYLCIADNYESDSICHQDVDRDRELWRA
jgi:hypothetical protein